MIFSGKHLRDWEDHQAFCSQIDEVLVQLSERKGFELAVYCKDYRSKRSSTLRAILPRMLASGFLQLGDFLPVYGRDYT